MGKPVVLLESIWKIEGTESAKSPFGAVDLAFRLVEEGDEKEKQRKGMKILSKNSE